MEEPQEPKVTIRPRGVVVGYLRVSSLDQNETRQLEGMQLDRKFVEHASGANTDRPELEELLKFVREGDTVCVHSMDRLARNLDDLRRLVLELTGRGVWILFVKENLTFTGDDSPFSHLLLSVLGAVAQFERDLIRERQREGIAIAKNNGVYKGRRRSLTKEQAAELSRRIHKGESATTLAREYKVSRQTLYRYTAAAV
jgi:DNA invertase Pin-like site-specific DNA recombinase